MRKLRETKYSPERSTTRRVIRHRIPQNKSRDYLRDQMGNRSQIAQEQLEIFPDNFGNHYKNVRDIEGDHSSDCIDLNAYQLDRR